MQRRNLSPLERFLHAIFDREIGAHSEIDASLSKIGLYAGNSSKDQRYEQCLVALSSQSAIHGDNPQARRWHGTMQGGAGSKHQCELAAPQASARPTLSLRDYTSECSMNLDAQWIVGFIDGEGWFQIGISRQPDIKLGVQVLPEFTVVQHERDVQVLHALKAYFGCGVVRSNNGDRMSYRVRKMEHLWERIIPFFEKHQLKTKKRVAFQKFRRVCLMMTRGDHLTEEGLGQIREIREQVDVVQERVQPSGKPGGTPQQGVRSSPTSQDTAD